MLDKIKTYLSYLILPLTALLYFFYEKNVGLEDKAAAEKVTEKLEKTQDELKQMEAKGDDLESKANVLDAQLDAALRADSSRRLPTDSGSGSKG